MHQEWPVAEALHHDHPQRLAGASPSCEAELDWVCRGKSRGAHRRARVGGQPAEAVAGHFDGGRHEAGSTRIIHSLRTSSGYKLSWHTGLDDLVAHTFLTSGVDLCFECGTSNLFSLSKGDVKRFSVEELLIHF